MHYQASMYESTYVIGKIERTLEIAWALKMQQVSLDIIMATTGLTAEKIEAL